VSTNPFKSFLAVKKKELPFVLLMFTYFFLVIGIFWILKPLKKALFVYDVYDEQTFNFFSWHLSGAEAEQIAKVANMVVAFVAVVAFTLLSRRLHRHQLTLVFAGFSAACMLAFTTVVGDPGELAAWAFYLFGDLFNTLMVATFFVFLNDSVTPERSKRLYGPIVLGGVTGGAVGSLWLAILIDSLSRTQWLLICTAATGVLAAVAWAAGRIVDRDPPPRVEAAPEEPVVAGNAALEGARLVFRSRYLLAIVTMVALYEIISTVMDYQFTSIVGQLAEDKDQHLATTYAVMNAVSFTIQVFLTGFLMQRFGVRLALLVMPIAILTNSGLFLVAPILLIGSGLNITDNAFNYSINQSARESLYTPTSRDEKYKAKAFIDMFIMRAGKSIAVGVNLALFAFFGPDATRWLSLFVIALVSAWVLAASYAGSRFRDLTGEGTPPSAPAPNRRREPKATPAPSVTSSGAYPKPARFGDLADGHSVT
jgi:ATP:ADP antiporter, AAA family